MNSSTETQANTPKLSLVIPAYNEENRLGDTLDKVAAYVKKQDYQTEVIVVDDGSADGTVPLAEKMSKLFDNFKLIQNGRNRGKGYSVKNGFQHATGEYRLFYDADASTPIEEVEKVWSKIEEGYEVVIGSRSTPGSEVLVHQVWYREKMGKIFNLFVRLFAMSGIIDTQCGFKCFSQKSLQDILPRQTIDGFSFDVELLYLSRRFGHSIAEEPVRWINSPASRVHPVRDSLKMLMELMSIRVKSMLGRYK